MGSKIHQNKEIDYDIMRLLMDLPLVMNPGNGKFTVKGFPWKTSSINGKSFIAMFDYQRVTEEHEEH